MLVENARLSNLSRLLEGMDIDPAICEECGHIAAATPTMQNGNVVLVYDCTQTHSDGQQRRWFGATNPPTEPVTSYGPTE